MTLFPSLLILVFILFFFISFLKVLRTRDDLFVVFYLFLFIYTIFTQIGYIFFPAFSIRSQVYFGIDLFYSYWLFIFLSFLATVGLFLFSNSSRKKRSIVDLPVEYSTRFPRLIFFLVEAFYLVALTVIFIQNFQNVRYANIDNIWIGYMINLQNVFTLILYMKYRRSHNGFGKLISFIMLLFSISLFVTISVRIGSRAAPLSLLIGIVCFEFSPFVDNITKHKARLLVMAAVIGIFLLFADKIVFLRNAFAGQVPINKLSQIMVFQPGSFNPMIIFEGDPSAPSSLLFPSMKFHWIYPGEVLRSNIYNFIPFTKYPYLQNILSGIANPYFNYSRTESYGYYLLIEGYNFGGWLGILYNAVIIYLGLGLWRIFASSRDRRFNQYMTAVLCMLVVGIVRSPSVNFVRSSYLVILPGMVLIALALGYFPVWRKIRIGIHDHRQTERMFVPGRVP